MMSKLPVLLVEGDSDSIFFQIARDELLSSGLLGIDAVTDLRRIQIETAALISSPSGDELGNREKVEYVCALAALAIDHRKLTGFVDREFRSFIRVAPALEDLNKRQAKVGHVWWSRGHSIENEFFDFAIMRVALRDLGVSVDYDVAAVLEIFAAHFDTALRIACALSLCGDSAGLLTWLHRTFSPEYIGFSDSELVYDLVGWAKQLERKHNLDGARASALVSDFKSRFELVQASDIEVVRWLCHGHIGEAFLWATFRAAILELCEQRGVPQTQCKVPSTSMRDRFVRYVSSWMVEVFRSGFDGTPLECFRDLGATI
jgi:hypothetical protein